MSRLLVRHGISLTKSIFEPITEDWPLLSPSMFHHLDRRWTCKLASTSVSKMDQGDGCDATLHEYPGTHSIDCVIASLQQPKYKAR